MRRAPRVRLWPPSRLSLDIYLPAADHGAPSRPGDRLLRLLGPTWRGAPVRRILQTACLLLFLYLFFFLAWPYGAINEKLSFERREWFPAESFLWIDPLVGLSTALAARAWTVALIGTGAVFLAGLLVPRGFCGYVCPLGTLIDISDFLLFRRISRFRVRDVGPWGHLKYYLLAAVLTGSLCGVLLSGFFAAIPVLTRGLQFVGAPLQTALLKDRSLVAPFHAAVYLSIALFAGIFLLSLLKPRFWCKYVCPTGATFSAFNFLRAAERKVDSSCAGCGKCVEVCPFDAIDEDFRTRANDCAFCQTCGGTCPRRSIRFASRWADVAPRPRDALRAAGRTISRRALLASGAAGALASAAVAMGRRPSLLRPPGSVEEDLFLDLCIRCGECFKVCPGPVLHPSGVGNGIAALWTPVVVPSIAGCHQDCNYCTQVCPTGAIVPLRIEEKRRFVMGLASIDAKTCLPHRGESDCDLCYRECVAAGYDAIEMRPIRLEVGSVPEGALPAEQIEQMGTILAPFVVAGACVGCGLCESRCHAAVVRQQKALARSAIVVTPVGAGTG